MTVTAVSATDEIKHHHLGVQYKSGKNSSEQHQGEKYSGEQYQNGQNLGGKYQGEARPVGTKLAVGTPGFKHLPMVYIFHKCDLNFNHKA
jgi:hypothetical protein